MIPIARTRILIEESLELVDKEKVLEIGDFATAFRIVIRRVQNLNVVQVIGIGVGRRTIVSIYT